MPTHPLASIGQQTDIILARILYRGNVPLPGHARQAAQGGRKMNLVDQTISNPDQSVWSNPRQQAHPPKMMP